MALFHGDGNSKDRVTLKRSGYFVLLAEGAADVPQRMASKQRLLS
jgi:hypothetical protein